MKIRENLSDINCENFKTIEKYIGCIQKIV